MKTKTLRRSVQSKIDEAVNAFELAFKALAEAKAIADHEDMTLTQMRRN